MAPPLAKVLVVEDDEALAGLLNAVLRDEGYAVEVLADVDPDAVRAAVGRLEPDAVLLDGESSWGYGRSWGTAAWLRGRRRPVPTLMLTAHGGAIVEAREGTSERARSAGLAGVIAKPFDVDELLEAVAGAVGVAVPFDGSASAETARTAALVGKLEAAGARDVRTSTRREWANFFAPDGTLRMLYWGQRDGVYYVLRQADGGGAMEQVGRCYDLEAAVAVAVGGAAG